MRTLRTKPFYQLLTKQNLNPNLMKTQVNIPNHQVDLFLDMCQQTCTPFEKIEEREVDTRFEILDASASICFMLGTSFGVRIGHRISTEAFK